MIAGTAAASLTGLMFVVITLLSGRERRTNDGITAVSTATVVHFGAALFIAMVLVAPWHSLLPPTVLLVLAAAIGLLYLIRVMLMTQRSAGTYEPDWEDRAFYTVLPFVAYGALLLAALALPAAAAHALYGVAAAVTLLVFIGIHNAWDIVTFITVGEGAE